MALHPHTDMPSVAAQPPQARAPRGSLSASSSWGGLSSMLRPAATERRAAAARTSWWAGMSRVLRAAGTNPQSRPLHAVLAGLDLSTDDGHRLR